MKTFITSVRIGMIGTLMLAGAGAPIAYAVDTTYVPLAPLPCVPSPAIPATTDSSGNTVTPATPAVTCANGSGSLETSVDFQTYVQYAFNLFIAVAAVAAVFMIVFGGFEYMTSDAVTGKKEGLTKIRHAVEGLLLVLCSYLILRTINPQFVNVPTSLVAPLNLTSSNTIASWADQLAEQANEYSTNGEILTQQRIQAQNTVTSLQNQLSTLQDQIENSGCEELDNDPNCNNLNLQAAQIENQISSTTATVSSSQGQSIFQNILADAANSEEGSSPSLYETYIQNANAVYNQTLTQLQQQGAVAQIATLNNAYNNAIGNLRVQEWVADAENQPMSGAGIDAMETDISNIQNTVGGNILPKVTDSSESATLTQSMSSAVAKIQSLIDSSNASLDSASNSLGN